MAILTSLLVNNAHVRITYRHFRLVCFVFTIYTKSFSLRNLPLWSFHKLWTRIRRHLKEIFLLVNIRWSEIGKQNIQVKNYHWVKIYYCAFHKHANSKIQKPPSQLRFSLPSIIITITSNEPWNTETHKTDRNPPITDHKPWPFEPV